MTERWAMMVEKESFIDFDGLKAVLADDVVKLLARQHRAFVRMVKKQIQIGIAANADDGAAFTNGYATACHDIIRALATHRKGRAS